MPATPVPTGGWKCTVTRRSVPTTGVQGSTLQSAGQLSLLLVLPSSQVSAQPGVLFRMLSPHTHASVVVVVEEVLVDVVTLVEVEVVTLVDVEVVWLVEVDDVVVLL